ASPFGACSCSKMILRNRSLMKNIAEEFASVRQGRLAYDAARGRRACSQVNFPGVVFTPRGQSVPPGARWLSRNAKRAVHAAADWWWGLVTKRGAAHIKVAQGT